MTRIPTEELDLNILIKACVYFFKYFYRDRSNLERRVLGLGRHRGRDFHDFSAQTPLGIVAAEAAAALFLSTKKKTKKKASIK